MYPLKLVLFEACWGRKIQDSALSLEGDFFFSLRYFSSYPHIWYVYCLFKGIILILIQSGGSAEMWRCPGRVQQDTGEKLSAQERQAAQSHETGQALNLRELYYYCCCHEMLCFCVINRWITHWDCGLWVKRGKKKNKLEMITIKFVWYLVSEQQRFKIYQCIILFIYII